MKLINYEYSTIDHLGKGAKTWNILMIVSLVKKWTIKWTSRSRRLVLPKFSMCGIIAKAELPPEFTCWWIAMSQAGGRLSPHPSPQLVLCVSSPPPSSLPSRRRQSRGHPSPCPACPSFSQAKLTGPRIFFFFFFLVWRAPSLYLCGQISHWFIWFNAQTPHRARNNYIQTGSHHYYYFSYYSYKN